MTVFAWIKHWITLNKKFYYLFNFNEWSTDFFVRDDDCSVQLMLKSRCLMAKWFLHRSVGKQKWRHSSLAFRSLLTHQSMEILENIKMICHFHRARVHYLRGPLKVKKTRSIIVYRWLVNLNVNKGGLNVHNNKLFRCLPTHLDPLLEPITIEDTFLQ